MKLTLRQAPAALPISQAEILAHLRITDSSPPDSADITRIAEGCVSEVQNWLRRALAPQAWSLWLDCFASCIRIPMPPLIAVESISYLDSDMEWQTLAPELYRVVDGGEDRSEIVLAPDQSWPATANTPSCIEVRFLCGYGDGSPLEPCVPGDIKNGLLELAALRYAVRDGLTFSTDRMTDELPAVKALRRYKVYA